MSTHVVVGGFWGDEGKGLVSAWIGLMTNSEAVFRGCGGSNPEHGIFFCGKYIKSNQLPLGWILQNSQIGLGPGTAVDVSKFLYEVNKFHLSPEKVKVDYRCPIITPENIQEEISSSKMNIIGSTKSGTGIAMAHAALRIAPVAQDIEELKPFLADIPEMVNSLSKNFHIGIESTQGTFLSRYYGDYPNVTSVDVTAPSVIAGTGLNFHEVEDVIVCIKALPTREGSGPMGNVGEFTFEEMENLGITEYSSIIDPLTGKHQIRRKAKGIDKNLLKRVINLNGANKIALTFAEHYDPEVKGVKKWRNLSTKLKKYITEIERDTSIEVILVNTGKDFSSMVSKNGELPEIPQYLRERLESYVG